MMDAQPNERGNSVERRLYQVLTSELPRGFPINTSVEPSRIAFVETSLGTIPSIRSG